MQQKEFIEKVVQFFSSQELYLDEFVAAKNDYFDRTGKIFEEDPVFESRMIAFTEWFAIDRPLSKIGLTPVQLYRELQSSKLTHDENDWLRVLMQSIHSLFIYRRRDRDRVLVCDLYDNREIEVFERRDYVGFRSGAVFEGRVLPMGGHPMFSETYCLHPLEVAGTIQNEIKRLKFRNRSYFILFALSLAARRLRADRYHKVDIHRIYDFANPEGFEKSFMNKRKTLQPIN